MSLTSGYEFPAVIATSLLLTFSGGLFAAEDPFASAIRPTEALSAEEELQLLQVPEGFRIQVFASEPEIQKPLNMAFDASGRLWVSGTVDYPYADLDDPSDSIRVLEDTDGDGRADRITTFVDGITLPLGLLPYRDGVIAFSIPNIWFFRDTDGDGQCDTREFLYGPFDFSRDTHGLNNAFRRGFDGWIYACHGFSNHSKVTGRDGNVVEMSSGNTYRFRPDGSRIEHYSYGQVNPFGMTFDARGDLFNSDCHTKPLTLILRDGQYEGFGRKHDGLGVVPPVMHHSHGSTAIAGTTQITGSHFPESHRDHFLAGNVMTSRVNRDSLTYAGSTMTAVEEDDFVVSRDPWFRPVDLQMGPDGAIYVADFYNKIIGHYEVPLPHPERDRHRGRIFRIEYVGHQNNDQAGKSQTPSTGDSVNDSVNDSTDHDSPLLDLSKATLKEVIAEAGSTNQTQQLRAITELSDRFGNEAVATLTETLEGGCDPRTSIGLIWALHRLNALPESILGKAIQHESPDVRIHAFRVLADVADWTAEMQRWGLQGLEDENSFVQRAAADALARHPDAAHLQPLLQRAAHLPAEDLMLAYQLKVAIRNQLRSSDPLAQLDRTQLALKERELLTQAALGEDSRIAATILLPSLSDGSLPPEAFDLQIERLAKWVTPDQLPTLIATLQARFNGNDPALLRSLVQMRQGLRLQGIAEEHALRQWGVDLIQRILTKNAQAGRWFIESPASTQAFPWHFETRRSDDDVVSDRFFSSLGGGEEAVSTLRSRTFTLPNQLSFFLCGHLGTPNSEPAPDNWIRLCLVEGDREIFRELPPRNDVARRIDWDLSSYAGQQGYLEIRDGISAGGYAWIAAGRFQPDLVPFPTTEELRTRDSMSAAAFLAGEFQWQELRQNLESLLSNEQSEPGIRTAAVHALARIQEDPVSLGLATLWTVPTFTSQQRHELLQLITAQHAEPSREEIIASILKSVSTRYQLDFSQALLVREEGAAELIRLCESGAVSPRVLESARVKPAMESLKNPELVSRFQTLLQHLPAASLQRDATIQDFSSRFGQSPRNAPAGRKVFENRCATCHQVQGLGKLIGPQLDGIGNRGPERLFEDVLDPNRNVDHAFRSRNYALENGLLYSGIFRREDGPLVVIADNKGEEHSFAKADIEEEAVANVSIMPDNWAEILPEAELLDLMAYLLEQKK